MKLKRLALAVSLAFTGGAGAQTVTLPAVSVSAPPVIEEVNIDRFSSTSAIVTNEQLRDQNAVDIASALRHTPGVQIQRFNPVGAFGDEGAVYIRGMGTSRPGSEIKPYVDGIPFYNGVWDHPLLDLLPINGMQSITVYKSPQPQINGNNFASINLQTRRATEDGVHGDARISAGSFGTVIEQANLLGRQGDLDFMLAQGYAKSDGHRANASGELKNAMGRVGIRLDANWSASASFIYADNKDRDPGDSRVAAPAVAPQYDTQAGMLSASLSHVHGDWRGDFRVYANQGDIQWRNRPAPEGDTLTHFSMSGVRWKEQFSPWAAGTVIVGVDLDRISGDVRFNRIDPAPRISFDTPTFRITSPYASLSQQIVLNRDWTLVPSAGLRFYDHSQFKSKSSPHAGVSLVSEQLTVFANVSRGINYPGLEAPSLAQVIPPLGSTWKQLSAEELDHAEVGVKFLPTDATQVDISFFDDRVKNRYIFGFPPDVPPPAQFLNLGSYRIKGAELAIRQTLGRDWTVFGSLTLLDPDIDNLPYTPRKALTAGLNGQVGPIRVVLDALYQSEVWALNRARAAGAVNTDKVSTFAVFNARLSYPLPALGKKGEVFLAVENLFDRSYEYKPGYPMPGRWGQIGLSASF
ncbi:MAG: TonB-dependent receptor [Burkholderiales bacterium]|nr:TonB-dependent receptor [Burkholderiales bacterium]